MEADTLVYVLAAALIVIAQVLIIVLARPRPAGIVEVFYMALPAVGVALLLVAAWRSVS